MTDSGRAPLANIGPLQRRRRRRLGLVALAAAVAVVLSGWMAGAVALARWPASLFFFAGFNGVFQARAKT